MIAEGCRCGAVRYPLAIETGPPIYRSHCTGCQRWTGSALSEQAVLRAGTLDASTALEPCAHISTPSKQPWVRLSDGVATSDRNAALADVAARSVLPS